MKPNSCHEIMSCTAQIAQNQYLTFLTLRNSMLVQYYHGNFVVNWNFSCNPQLITLQALVIKLSTTVTIYEAEIGASCHLDKHKKLMTMAGLFPQVLKEWFASLKLLIQIAIINKITEPLGLDPLFIDQQIQGSDHTKCFKTYLASVAPQTPLFSYTPHPGVFVAGIANILLTLHIEHV